MAELLYIGFAGGIEDQAVPNAGIPLFPLRLTTPDSLRNRVRFLGGFLAATVSCLRRIGHFDADVVLSTGGFVGLPATVAAWLRRIPVVVYLPDAVPGKAVRLSRFLASSIAVTIEETADILGPSGRVHVTGYPVRSVFMTMTREVSRAQLGLQSGDIHLLVIGGSQGSAVINSAVVSHLSTIVSASRVLHVCGPRHVRQMEAARAELPEHLRNSYRVVPSLDSEEMAAAMFASDLAVTRAGASILGELPAAGLPAVIIPLPINAQDANAAVLQRAGAGVVMGESRAGADLATVLVDLLKEPTRLSAMRAAMAALYRPDASDCIARLVVDAVTHAP